MFINLESFSALELFLIIGNIVFFLGGIVVLGGAVSNEDKRTTIKRVITLLFVVGTVVMATAFVSTLSPDGKPTTKEARP